MLVGELETQLDKSRAVATKLIDAIVGELTSNRTSESNFFQRRKPERERLQNLLDILEHMGTVLPHLFRPSELGIFEYRLQNEERTIEAQRFPALGECPARFAGLDDHRRVAEQSHRAVTSGEVRA